MDLVPGALQKPVASLSPQLESSSQPKRQREKMPVQNCTSFVAERHCVPDAERHLAPPTYTVQSPPQSSPSTELQ